MSIDLNEFAEKVTKAEGGAENLSIAQVKEVIKCTFTELAIHPDHVILETVKKYKA